MGARTTLRRRLEWGDTDAAAMWHHSTLWRWFEAAEADLHRDLGITPITFGWMPRRAVQAEFLGVLRFDDAVEVRLEVEAVGRTSVTYAMEVARDDALVATAEVTAVLVDADGRPRSWPTAVADALRTGAPVELPAST